MSQEPTGIVRLYLGQHGQTASTVVTAADGQAILQAVVGRVPFFLSTEEVAPNREVIRTSVFVVVPSSGGLVLSLSKAEPIPLDAAGRPIPLGTDGRPVAQPAAWDDPRKAPRSTFERLPWSAVELSPQAVADAVAAKFTPAGGGGGGS